MKVFILTEGGKNIGLGHIARCSALYEAFQEKGILPAFIVNGDVTVKEILKNKRYKIFDWAQKNSGVCKALNSADVVIVDSYLAGIDFYNKISRIVKAAIYIDDNKRLSYPSGTVLNGSIYAKGMGYPETNGRSRLLGIEYAQLRKEFWRVPRKRIRSTVGSVMITFGGNDPRNMTVKILRLLVDSYPGLEKKVVLAQGFSNIKEINEIKDLKTKLFYKPCASRMKEIMLASDIAISAAGQTLHELARVGVPAIVIATAENQLNNLRGWQKAGFIGNGLWWEDEDIASKVLAQINRLLHKKERLKKSMLGRKLIDGKGSLRVCDFLLKDTLCS